MTEHDTSPAPTEMPKSASNALRRARDKVRRGRCEEALVDLDKALPEHDPVFRKCILQEPFRTVADRGFVLSA